MLAVTTTINIIGVPGTKIFSLEDNLRAFEPGHTPANLSYQAQSISNFLLESVSSASSPDIASVGGHGCFSPVYPVSARAMPAAPCPGVPNR